MTFQIYLSLGKDIQIKYGNFNHLRKLFKGASQCPERN